MTSPPDWLVERVALDEVPATSRDRVEQADPAELADRVAALRADNAAELATYPAGPAVAQIEARVATSKRKRRNLVLGAMSVAAVAAVAIIVFRPEWTPQRADETEVTRVKGATRLLAFRLIGDQVEKLGADAIVHAGDLIQLRYNAGGQKYGLIASIDGAGAVTLHYPAAEDASPDATAIAPKPTALPNAYQLDDAPRFERFFFITCDDPIDVKRSLEALRERAQRGDAATAWLEMPEGMRQWSLRLRKPSSNPKAPTP